MIFESNGYLEWCLECPGSPMKRFRNNAYDSSFLWAIEPIPHTNSDGWNTWNVEVREDSIKMYINGQFLGESFETEWINDPYFGFFVSTDEYSNSTWRIDYIEIRTLDN